MMAVLYMQFESEHIAYKPQTVDDICIGVSQPRNKKTRACLLARQMNENGLIDILGRGAQKNERTI